MSRLQGWYKRDPSPFIIMVKADSTTSVDHVLEIFKPLTSVEMACESVNTWGRNGQNWSEHS